MRKLLIDNNAIIIIPLIITIIVLLILAGITIALFMGGNGIITKSIEAKKGTEEAYEKEKSELDKIVNKIDEILNFKKNENDNDNIKGNSAYIRENSSTTYGKEVANYIVKNAKDDEIQADKDVKWKIFYADDSNTYLIADGYVKNSALPYARKLNEDETTTITNKLPNKFAKEDTNCPNGKDYRAHFVDIISEYSGLDRVLANKTYGNSLKKLNSKFFDMFSDGKINNSTKKHGNNKAVAYMQDVEAWSIYKDEEGYAEYAIGGPSVEMLYDSYMQTHSNSDKKHMYTVTGENKETNENNAKGTGSAGYQISWDGGQTWKTITEINSSYLSSDMDELYTGDGTHQKAYGYWLSSPSAQNDETIMVVYYYGKVRYYHYNNELMAFRPVVCLSSDVTLSLNEQTGKYEISK